MSRHEQATCQRLVQGWVESLTTSPVAELGTTDWANLRWISKDCPHGSFARTAEERGLRGLRTKRTTSVRNAAEELDQLWTENSPEFFALQDHLLEVGSAQPILDVDVQIVPAPAIEVLMQGDPERGRERFNTSCAVCHGQDGVGTQQAPPITGFGIEIDRVARRIRSSGSTTSAIDNGLTGGRMPFWGANRLSDEEAADLAAYVAVSEDPRDEPAEVDGPGSPPEVSGPQAPPEGLPSARECSSASARIGQTAMLQAFSHDVGGTVEIVDDCTLRFNDFQFDGAGIRVEFYLQIDGEFETGVGPNLLRSGGYEGANFDLTLPDGLDIDDVEAISVWCVPVGISFGDGAFE